MPEAKKTIYANCLGVFVFDEKNKLIDKELFDTAKAISFLEKPGLKNPDAKVIEGLPPPEILEAFRDEKFFEDFRERNILFTKYNVKNSFSRDQLILQTIAVIEDLDKGLNSMAKRLRDWYALQSPEIVNAIESHERFVKSIIAKNPKQLCKELRVDDAMGAELPSQDMVQIQELARSINDLYILKEEQNKYLEVLMKEIAPNIQAIAGTMIGAKLMSLAGSLEKMSKFPASTLQLLGAEKALFRHLKTGAKSPKYGVLVTHPLVANAKRQDKGKIARALADKISIASKVDYFKGDFIGEKLLRDLEAKFK